LFLYYPMLLISAVLFIISERFLCFGDGILVWGLINFGDHFFYTIKDRKRSPGLFSGVLFLINSVLGIRCFLLSQTFSLFPIIVGVIIGGILFGLPIALCVVVLINIFGRKAVWHKKIAAIACWGKVEDAEQRRFRKTIYYGTTAFKR